MFIPTWILIIFGLLLIHWGNKFEKMQNELNDLRREKGYQSYENDY